MTNLTNNKAVLSWIDEMTAITKPDKIVWITGEEEQLGALREQAVKEGMRDVRMALLEADVNYLVVKDFCKKVTERCVGQQVLDSLHLDHDRLLILALFFLLAGERSDNGLMLALLYLFL